MEAANAIIFEGATADAHETTLSIVDPTADHTQYLINQGGYIPVLAAATTTAITSTPAELNVLDGITSTTAELNILDGVTATAAELNIMDGVTATTAELNYVDGVTSNIQTQLDATLDTAGTGIDISSTTISVDVSDFMANGANNYVLTATGTDAFRGEGNLTFDGSTLAVTGAITGSSTLNVTGVATFQNHLELGDSDEIKLGAGSDFKMYHDGTDSLVYNYTGNLYIRNNADDKDIIFQSDDGSGGTTAYFYLDGSATKTVFAQSLQVADSKALQLGNAADAELFHNGTYTNFANSTGDFYISQNTDDGDLILRSDDGSGGVTAYLTLDGSESRLDFFSGRIYLKNDGTFHWGSAAAHGVLTWDTGRAIVGGLGSNNLDLKAQSGYSVVVNESGSNVDFRVEGDTDTHLIFADASTDRVGIGTDSPTDTLQVDGSIGVGVGRDGQLTSVNNGLVMRSLVSDADMYFYVNDGGVDTLAMKIDGSAVGNVSLPNDNQGLHIGASSDLQLYHQSDHNYILTQKVDADLYIRHNTSGGYINAIQIDGSDAGTAIFNHDVKVNDNGKLKAGSSNDFQMMHDATNSYLINATGNLYIQATADDKDIVLQSDDGSGGVTAYLTLDGSATDIKIAQKMQFPASHSADKIVMYSGGNEKIGTEANTMLFTADNYKFKDTNGDDNLFMNNSGNVGIGTTSPATKLEVDGILTMEDVTAPAEGVAGHAQMFSNGGEMKVNDASGNVTTISPHNFELIPEGASEDMAWSHHSVKGNKKVNVDMMRLARLVEELTGEKLVYTEET